MEIFALSLLPIAPSSAAKVVEKLRTLGLGKYFPRMSLVITPPPPPVLQEKVVNSPFIKNKGLGLN